MFGIFKRVKALEEKLKQTRNDYLKEKYVGKYVDHAILGGPSDKIIDVCEDNGKVLIKIHLSEFGCFWQSLECYRLTDKPTKSTDIFSIQINDKHRKLNVCEDSVFSKQVDEMIFSIKVADTNAFKSLVERIDEINAKLLKFSKQPTPVSPKTKKK